MEVDDTASAAQGLRGGRPPVVDLGVWMSGQAPQNNKHPNPAFVRKISPDVPSPVIGRKR